MINKIYCKKGMLLTAITLSMSLVLTGCKKEEKTIEKKAVVVETSVPETGDLIVKSNFMGTVSPEEAVYVMALVNGEVTKCNVKVGDRVAEGDILGEIDDAAAELQLDSANASLATVQANKTAATGGANTLQNMQTEANIDTIKDNMEVVEEKRVKVADAQDEVKKQMDELDKNKKKAKEAYKDAKANVEAAEALAVNPKDKKAKKTLKEAGYEVSETNPVEVVLATCQATKAATKTAYDQIKAAYDQNYPLLEKQYDELDGSKKEIVRNYESLQGNLKVAEDSYAISKDQVAKETAAVYDAQIASAKVGVESAKYQQDMYVLKAPIDGIVEAVNIEENGFASSGSPAFVVSNKNSMKVTFKVSEEIQKTLNIGDKIEVERNGAYFEGTITQVGQMVDAQSGLFLVEANVNAGGDDLLTGTSVKLTVDTYKALGSLIIPYDAIFYDDELAYVYVAKDGKAVKTQVEVALFNDTQAAISSGLTSTDEVITTYSASLSNETSIAVKESGE